MDPVACPCRPVRPLPESRRRPRHPHRSPAARGFGANHPPLDQPHRPATLTPAQVQRRIGPLLPPVSVYIDEQDKLDHDLQGLVWLAKARNRVPVLWRNNGWLKPHYVYLVHLPDHHACTVTITAATAGDWARGSIRHSGRVTQRLDFPTRIHAETHALQMLHQLIPWRIVAPADWKLPAPTRCWLDTAPDGALRTTHESHATTHEER